MIKIYFFLVLLPKLLLPNMPAAVMTPELNNVSQHNMSLDLTEPVSATEDIWEHGIPGTSRKWSSGVSKCLRVNILNLDSKSEPLAIFFVTTKFMAVLI